MVSDGEGADLETYRLPFIPLWPLLHRLENQGELWQLLNVSTIITHPGAGKMITRGYMSYKKDLVQTSIYYFASVGSPSNSGAIIVF